MLSFNCEASTDDEQTRVYWFDLPSIQPFALDLPLPLRFSKGARIRCLSSTDKPIKPNERFGICKEALTKKIG